MIAQLRKCEQQTSSCNSAFLIAPSWCLKLVLFHMHLLRFISKILWTQLPELMLAEGSFFELFKNIHREQILDLKHKLFIRPTSVALTHSVKEQKALCTKWKECSTGRSSNVCNEQSGDLEIIFAEKIHQITSDEEEVTKNQNLW